MCPWREAEQMDENAEIFTFPLFKMSFSFSYEDLFNHTNIRYFLLEGMVHQSKFVDCLD